MRLHSLAWLTLGTLALACDEGEAARSGSDDASSDGAQQEVDAAALDEPLDAGSEAHDASEAPDAGDGAPQDAASEPELALFRSGSRLRAQGYRVDGPLLAFGSMYDTQLSTSCSYRFAADGERYCMPAVEESSAHALPGYMDAACTAGALLRSADCAPPAPFHLVTELACRTSTRVQRVGVESDQTVWYSKEVEGCVARTLLPGQKLYPLGETMPLTTFVRGTPERAQQTGLTRELLVGSDGSRAPVGVHDTTRNVGCAPVWLGNAGGMRCVASERAFEAEDGWFLGEQCTQPVAFALPTVGACRQPRFAVRLPSDAMGCQAGGAPSQLRELGALTSSVYTRDFDNLCKHVPLSTTTNYSFYELGAVADTASLPALHAQPVGAGRIRPYVWQGSEGQTLGYLSPEGNPYPLLFDTALDSPCEVVSVAGELLCAPPRGFVVYSDADCEQPLLEVFEGEDCALALPGLIGVRGARADRCGQLGEHAQITLYRRAGPVAAPATRHVRFQGSCVVATSPAIRARYFALGESLPSSGLARLTLSVE